MDHEPGTVELTPYADRHGEVRPFLEELGKDNKWHSHAYDWLAFQDELFSYSE
ncbi:MAG: hypothetical protein LBI39_02680 [Puniceicoccales bacterium]|nr:hypothetical protein [Puniceicoccales bacterium]